MTKTYPKAPAPTSGRRKNNPNQSPRWEEVLTGAAGGPPAGGGGGGWGVGAGAGWVRGTGAEDAGGFEGETGAVPGSGGKLELLGRGVVSIAYHPKLRWRDVSIPELLGSLGSCPARSLVILKSVDIGFGNV